MSDIQWESKSFHILTRLIDRELKLFLMNRGNVGDQGDTTLREDDIGWPESFKRDAQSDRSETIFRYVIEKVGLFLDTVR